jgi:phage-related protein
MQEEEPVEPVQVTEEEALYALRLLDSLARRGELERLIEVSLERFAIQAEEVARELERVASKLMPRISELDLEAMAGHLFNITDIIGQIQAWLADQLKGLASWFSSIVSGIVSNLWSTFIKPALDAIGYAVSGITGKLADVTSGLSNLAGSVSKWFSDIVSRLSSIGDAVKGVASALSGVRDALSSALAGAVSSISQALGGISSALRSALDALSRIPGAIIDALRSAIGAATSALSSLIQGIGSALQGLAATISNLFSKIASTLAGLSELVSRGLASLAEQMASGIKGLAASFGDFASRIGSAVSGLAELASKGFSALGSMIGGVLDTLKSLWSALDSALKSAAEGIGKAVASLGEQVVGALKGLAGTVSDFFGKIASSLASVADYLSKGFSGLADALKSGLGDLWSKVQGAIAAVSEAVSKALAPVVEMVSKGFAELGRWMAEASKALQQVGVVIMGYTNALLQLPQAISGFFKWISDAIEGVKTALENFFKDPVGAIKKALEDIGKWIWSALPGWLRDAVEFLVSFFKELRESLSGSPLDLRGFFKGIFDWLAGQIWNLLPDWLKGAITAIQDFFAGLAKGLEDFIKDPLGFIQRGFSWLAEQIWKLMPDWLKDAITAAQGFFSWLWDQLQDFAKNAADRIYNAFKWLGEEIWKHLPEPLKWIIENVQKALASAWDAIVKFFTKDLPGFFSWLWEKLQEFAKDPWGTLGRGLYWVGEQIWNLLPESVRNFLTAARNGLAWVWEQLMKLAKDPLGTLWSWLVELGKWLWNGIQSFVGAVWGAMRELYKYLSQLVTGFAAFLYEALQGSIRAIAGAIASTFTALAGWATAVGQGVKQGMVDLLGGLIKGVMQETVGALAETLKKLGKEGGPGEITLLAETATAAASLGVILEVAGRASKYAAHLVRGKHLGYAYTITVSPLGAGGTITHTYGVYISPGRIFYELGDYLSKLGGSISSSVLDLLPRGLGLIMEPAFMYTWRGFLDAAGLGDLPVSPPALPLVVTAAQRMGLVEESEKGWGTLYQKLHDYMMYRAYPWWFRSAVLGVDEKRQTVYVEVVDRFGKKVAIPLGMVFEMPTPSELAEMMVRDAFKTYGDYVKWAVRLGTHPNVARFYYFLRFRYPDPRILWNFAMRAASNMLWYAPTDAEKALAKADAESIGAYEPKAPADLNGDIATAFQMLTTFLKWQDFATFAWSSGWPSDAWVIADTMADIPSKLDARWLVRFGVTDWLAKLGMGAATKPWDMAKMALSDRPESELTLDVRLLCKFLQATGLHPYYVPLSAVAEAMSAVVDERTLIRTGVTNLYERGLANLDTLQSLLEDMGTITFAVSYFDMTEGQWKDKYVNVPLTFLPAERRLITMRSEIDRHLEVYGKVLAEVARGVRELSIAPEEGKKLLMGFAEAVAERLSASMKGIVGREVRFEPDEAYYDLWIRYAQATARIETAYRLRLLGQRILGWVIYRVATGYVTDEELERVVACLKDYYTYTDEEIKAVRELARAVNNIAVRETQRSTRARVALEEAVPSLGTLASMAEYIEVPMDFIQQVLAERRVTGTYAELWLKYLMARTISSEVNTLTSTYRRIVEYFGLPETLEKQIKELMRAGGWTDREIQIFDLDLYLRRAYRILSTFIPTLRQFVGDAQYLGEWEKLFDDLIRARGLDAEKYKAQVEYYKKLIKARKLWRRVSMFITEEVNCYAYGIIDEATLRSDLEPLKTYGLDDLEIDLIVKTAERRAQRIAATRRR